MTNDGSEERNQDASAAAPAIPPLVRSPYPTRSRRRQLHLQQHQQRTSDSEDQLTADPLGLIARTASGSSVSVSAPAAASPPPESSTGIAPTVTTRRRKPAARSSIGMHATSLFSTPAAPTPPEVAATTTTTAQFHPPQSAASDYMIGRGLVQARISPMAPGSGGPNSAKNARRRRFFPPGRPSTGGPSEPATPADDSAPRNEPGETTTSNNNNNNHRNNNNNNHAKTAPATAIPNPTKDLILHGMNITKLRKLTLSCLGMTGGDGLTTQSPKMAVFFAGMVHSKTQSPEDAYIYARALLQNEQPKRTVKWIEQANLLRCYYSEQNLVTLETEPDGVDDTTTEREKKKAKQVYERLEELKTLQVEALLLAAQSLGELSDWTAVLQLLEDTQHYTFPESHHEFYEQQQQQQQAEAGASSSMDHDDTENSFHPNHMTIVTTGTAAVNPSHTTSNPVTMMPPPSMPLIPQHLDDDDDIAWQQLADSLRPWNNNTPDKIHPLSRICQLRARAYSELGHPLRANLYWNRALQIDPWCVLALEGLLETSVQAPSSVVESVLVAMSNHATTAIPDSTKNDNTHPPHAENDDTEWLRALYLARVCTAAPSTANLNSGSHSGAPANDDNNEAAATDGISAKQTTDGDDPMEDETDENDDGNGDENMTTTSFALTPNMPSRSSRSRMRSNDAENEEQPAGSAAAAASVGDDSNDPSFWQDASSIQLLTPIPQQQSMADMSAAGASLFFPQSANSNNNSDHSTLVANLSSAQAKAAAVGSALDTLWNKFQLRNSPEVLAMAAQNAYRRYDWDAALQFCDELAEVDPLSSNTNKAAFCHVSTLVQLHRKRPLFRLAHEWVETNPKEARSWFAVGAYYYACERYHVAQRHFCRATRLDPHCVEAWIAFGASFAACDESDQALASFRAAQRLAPGNHTSLLYIAMEYLRTNHLVLAQHFLKAANDSSGGTDPLVKTETGVLKLNQKKYSQAITWFLMALGGDSEWTASMNKLLVGNISSSTVDTNPKYLDALSRLIETVQDPYWEPTLFNLAHAYRKERRFDASVICLEQCLALKESASAHSALGYCLHLQSMVLATKNNIAKHKSQFQPRSIGLAEELKRDRDRSNQILHKAIDAYHQSLAKKPDDPFASEMLQKALADALEQTDFFLNDDDFGTNVASDMHPALASPAASAMRGSDEIGMNHHHHRKVVVPPSQEHHHHHTPKPPRGSLGSLSTTTTGMGLNIGADQSSLWTEDGLSVSADDSTNDDVDMT